MVWAQEGAPVHLPCGLKSPDLDPNFLRRGGVIWQHQPDRYDLQSWITEPPNPVLMDKTLYKPVLSSL